MKRWLKIIAAALGSLQLMGCMNQKQVNPLQHYISIAAMYANTKLDFQVPTDLPGEYILSQCYITDGKVVSLEYSDGTQSFLYRTAKKTKELSESGISGDFQDYPYSWTESVDGVTNAFSSTAPQDQDAPCLVTWEEDGMLYSLSGLPAGQAQDYIISLEKVSKVPDADWIARPEKTYDTLEELAQAVEIPALSQMQQLEQLPGGYVWEDRYLAIGSVIGSVSYRKGEDTLSVSLSRGNSAAQSYFDGDLSGSVSADGVTATMAGRGEMWYTLSFPVELDGEPCSCQIRSSVGVTQSFLESVFPVVLEQLTTP